MTTKNARITLDPNVTMGKPVIRGTRITVEHILRSLAAGDSVEELLADYPSLTVEDIRAAQAFAADLLAHEWNAVGRKRAWERLRVSVANVRDTQPEPNEDVAAEEERLAAQVTAARRES